jgi:hypothetical protein
MAVHLAFSRFQTNAVTLKTLPSGKKPEFNLPRFGEDPLI